jgi:ankyrin repeat protein
MPSLYINRGTVFTTSRNMYTGFMYACENGHVDIVKMPLQTEGVTKEWVDTVASDGNTALTLAASSRSIDCVSALISFGANVIQSYSGHMHHFAVRRAIYLC